MGLVLRAGFRLHQLVLALLGFFVWSVRMVRPCCTLHQIWQLPGLALDVSALQQSIVEWPVPWRAEPTSLLSPAQVQDSRVLRSSSEI